MRSTTLFTSVLFLAGYASVFADEGMWTFDNPPSKQLADKYHFTPDRAWFDRVRLASARVGGASGSFVSPHGLLLTNHHVARGQLQKNSTREHNYLENGYYAATPDQELKSPDLEVNVLESMEDVTQRVQAALTPAKTDVEALAARRAIIAQIERESMQATGLRSDVVTLYSGGEYWLYRYKRYTDVRLVFAPEEQAAFFGGDPDNFTYPRYDFDLALFRVYENGRPIDSRNYLKWNARGAADGELVFLSGNPGSTQRQDTMAQLEQQRDLIEPTLIHFFQQRIAVLQAYSAQGPEQALEANSSMFGLQNSLKAYQGRYAGLLDKALMQKKGAEESDFKTRVEVNPEWRSRYGGAWSEMAQAVKAYAPRFKERLFERNLDSQMLSMALQIVQYVEEIKKPDGQRLPGFHEAQLESLRFRLLSPAPIYKGLEQARLAGWLNIVKTDLSSENPFLKTITAGRSPAQAASELVNGTKMNDLSFRKALLEGGSAAVNASTDPMVVLARKLDPISREMTHWYEQNVQSPEEAAGEKLGKARFLVYGKSVYPDATGTLRLSYGAVKGYPMNGTVAPYKTTIYGLFDRAASFDFSGPWSVVSRWKEGRNQLDLSTPMNFVSTCDSIGGNSGSPVINRNAELVGLLFDGNIESLAGDFEYEPERNRSVAVHSAVIIEGLRKLYGAGKLADELEGVSR